MYGVQHVSDSLKSHHLFADLMSKQADDAKLSCKHHAGS